ncbi:hypothetical protein [Hyalangium rubrum]|uniref:DUF2157 domain-containing protein n=1 Tax=Hyalangium rubrum TaxID=3103134 RepID=A0ABU5H1U6_9BACT|nr:hypothetical protein [Hyalangium sp. s54d21]MDY7227404.1 hypothetical protein [Hyalangium sp. s54d21]
MAPRPREAVEAELAHIHFILEEMKRWDDLEVSPRTMRYLTARYERQVRVLLSVLADGSAPQVAPAVEPAAPVPTVDEVAVQAAVEEPAPVQPAPVEAPSVGAAQAFFTAPVEEEARTPEPEPLPKVEELLPPVTTEPIFDAPAPRSLTARIVEETSTWDRIWRPFLYESIGWFVGAFLILAGTLYFVFESWSGMTSLSRSLVVFGMTAFYSVGFSAWGAFLARRQALQSAGRILGLIGSAVAPLAGLALGPMGGMLPLGEALGLDGVHPALLVPLLLGWSALAAVMVRRPAEALDAPSRPLIQASIVVTTVMMGLAPLAARLGAPALWLNALPCALFFVLSRRTTAEPRQGAALAFALVAPLYLLALFAIRLHLALVAAGTPPSAGTYAPFLAFLLATCLAFRELPEEKAADSLSIAVAALQVGCIVLAGTGAPPAFCFTSAVFTWTVYRLSKGSLARLSWLYPTYFGAYLAYASSGQLIPGFITTLIALLKARLGYPPSEKLPFQFGALTALPFVLAGVVLAARWMARAERGGDGREARIAEVLLRSTAAASGLFVLVSLAGPDLRPALWSALALSVVCVFCGLWFERFYLACTGALVMLVVPFAAHGLFGPAVASVVCGLPALVFAGLASVCSRRTRLLFSSAVGVLALVGFLFGLTAGTSVTSAVGIGLVGAAALLATWALADPWLIALAAFVLAAAVPKLAAGFAPLSRGAWEGVSPAMAAVAVGLALLGERGGRLRLLGVPGTLYAFAALVVAWGVQTPALGVILLASAAAVAIASRSFPAMRPFAVVIAGLALLPSWPGVFVPWSWMTPGLSMGLILLWSLGASLATVRWGRGPSTLTAGFVALLLALAPALAVDSREPHMGLLLCAALAALLTARAVPPSLSVLVAAGYATVGLGPSPVALLGLAAFLSVLALLEERRAVAAVLAGGGRFALAAILSSVGVLAVALLTWEHAPVDLLLAGTVVLPLLWMRASRKPVFAALGTLFTAGTMLLGGAVPVFAPALPLLALLVVRAVEHLPAARSLLLGPAAEAKLAQRLSEWMQGTLLLVGLGMLAVEAGIASRLLLIMSLALMPGRRPSVRVGLATLLLAFIPEARPVAAGVLLALGVLEYHRPSGLAAFFRCAPDSGLRPLATLGALALTGVSVIGAPTPGALAGMAGVLFVAAFLLSLRWLLTASVLVLALVSLGETELYSFMEARPLAALAFAGVALAAALLSAVCQSGRVQRALSSAAAKVLPSLEDTWSEPFWGAGVLTLGGLLAYFLFDRGPGVLPLVVAVPAGLAALVLMVSREEWMAYVATALLGGVLVATVSPVWLPVVVGGTGLALCLVGTVLDAREFSVGRALHHGGWMLSLLALAGLQSVRHVSAPLSFALATGAAWAVVYRRRSREVVGWLATLVSVHVLVMFLGATFSSGRGKEFIVPHLGAATALLATVALSFAGEKVRRGVGHFLATVALLEVFLGVLVVDGSRGALREALVAVVGLGVLVVALVRRAVTRQDALSVYYAQVAVALGYLGARLLGMGVEGLSVTDSLVALGGGAFFSGLYVFVQRESSGLPAFRRPALLGAFLFPLAGLLTAPWDQPAYAAALLAGHAAHFAALATHPSRRGLASVASVVAFNAALLVLWAGIGAGEPQYYVIPAGLSLLVLLRIFRDSLAPDTVAWMRACAVTVIYVAGAWKPLMFSDAGGMLLCVLVCLLGVMAGIALRIRSYVYLGTAFLVTCIVANLVRFGMRDHRVGAAFLSLLGLLVVGFMVLLSAHREKLLARYTRVRSMLSTWEG